MFASLDTLGSIPACAGEPRDRNPKGRDPRVDPRVCGGAHRARPVGRALSGRSPRVRGSRVHVRAGSCLERSIPACAGEPRNPRRYLRLDQVDPRVCGGALCTMMASGHRQGRSPRVRGSLVQRARIRDRIGSIPACAGEPPRRCRRAAAAQVDPRVCGGAIRHAGLTNDPAGRSPRVRGSRRCRSGGFSPSRSIPACAGEPAGPDRGAGIWQVDPRVCGGASVTRCRLSPLGGRSPRVRGSPDTLVIVVDRVGSIPACAGEPIATPRPAPGWRVDPRVCGGAVRCACSRSPLRGRSPRVRGSLADGGQQAANDGSIPACAGEPMVRRCVPRSTGVDPRVCGGACGRMYCGWRSLGRSPRVRGSHQGPQYAHNV